MHSHVEREPIAPLVVHMLRRIVSRVQWERIVVAVLGHQIRVHQVHGPIKRRPPPWAFVTRALKDGHAPTLEISSLRFSIVHRVTIVPREQVIRGIIHVLQELTPMPLISTMWANVVFAFEERRARREVLLPTRSLVDRATTVPALSHSRHRRT